MIASVPPAASNAAVAMSPMSAGASVGPASAFEAMLATLFGPVDAQGAGLFAAGAKDPLAADATTSDDSDQAAADPQSASASAQAQSLMAAFLVAIPPPATPGQPPQITADASAPPVGADGVSGLPAAAGAKLDLSFMGLGKIAGTAPDATGATLPPPTQATAPAAPEAVDLAALQPPPASTAQVPEPPAPIAPTPLSSSQATLAAQTPPTLDPNAPALKADARGGRNDGPRRNAGLFVNPGLDTTSKTAPPGLAHAVQAGTGPSTATGFAAAAVAARAGTGDTPEAADPQSAAGDGSQPRSQPPGQAPAAPLTSAPAMAAPAVALRGAPETVANLAAQILKKLDGRSTRFDVELDPAGLGRVDVRLEIGAHGRMSAAMAFDNPQAAQELRSRSGELARALEQAGFDVSGGLSFDVAGDPGQSGRGAPRDQNDNAGSAWRGRAFQAALDASAEADTGPSGGLNLRRRLLAGVDIKI
ncbi:flagellar hook-length control protein FliK [Phenylobacterium sp.]|jgi:Meckel syndrome type 1 protein|uniref:flagellar hook-length control protein FliK n=1 Tax=Phenylobacterium sp. TaxID=1871053 RepID=UPI002F3E20B7